MNKELLEQRIESLQKTIEQGACEINKSLGRLDEAKMWHQYLTDKEAKEKELKDTKDEEIQDEQHQ